ncbi:YbhQ family protein [Enterobacteriaceae bacterium LUAb1]
MKWSNRIQIVTGQTCLHISLHLLLIVALIWGWKHQALMVVSAVLLACYGMVFLAMVLIQRITHLRTLGDFLEEVTTTYYFGAAILALFLLSHIIHHSLLLGCLGGVMLAGPALVSLLTKGPSSVRVSPKKRF